MLRLLVLLLLLANAAFFAWAQGLLAPVGLQPAQQAEPQRVAQQVRPEALRVMPPEEARRFDLLAAATPRAPECLATGPLEQPVVGALRVALESWPAGSWALEAAADAGRWIVYMGPYPDNDAVNRKKAELRQIGVSFEPLSNPALEPGLSLGGAMNQPTAEQLLAALQLRGVRTARVVQERPQAQGPALRLPVVDDALRARLDELRPALAGRPLRPCR